MSRAVSTAWIAWLVLMAGANLATPLYAVYAQEFGFSSLVLTSILRDVRLRPGAGADPVRAPF